jgi:hypothetical protein
MKDKTLSFLQDKLKVVPITIQNRLFQSIQVEIISS